MTKDFKRRAIVSNQPLLRMGENRQRKGKDFMIGKNIFLCFLFTYKKRGRPARTSKYDSLGNKTSHGMVTVGPTYKKSDKTNKEATFLLLL